MSAAAFSHNEYVAAILYAKLQVGMRVQLIPTSSEHRIDKTLSGTLEVNYSTGLINLILLYYSTSLFKVFTGFRF